MRHGKRRLRRVLRRTDRRLRTARTPDEIIAAFERFTVEIAPLNARPAASRRIIPTSV
jgi:hypothetical protein